MTGPGRSLWAFALALLAAAPGHGAEPAPMLPWLKLSENSPPAIRHRHEIVYDPVEKTASVKLSRLELEGLAFEAFGGKTQLIADADVAPGHPADLATTLTLTSVDIQRVLSFLELPRAAEVEALAGGSIAVEVHAGEWRRVEVSLSAAPGSARMSRRLLIDLLTRYLNGVIEPEKIHAAVDHYYGPDAKMIPLADLELSGRLDRQVLAMKLPLHNDAMAIVLEPRIEAPLLWDLWEYLRGKGLQDVSGFDVQ